MTNKKHHRCVDCGEEVGYDDVEYATSVQGGKPVCPICRVVLCLGCHDAHIDLCGEEWI